MYTGTSRTTRWRNRKDPNRSKRDFGPAPIKEWKAEVADLLAAKALARRAVQQLGIVEGDLDDAAQEILISWAQGRSWMTGAAKVKAEAKEYQAENYQLTETELVVAIDLRATGINSMEQLLALCKEVS